MSVTHDDRRSHPRFEVNRAAVVVAGGVEIHCTVQNLSSLGAGLIFDRLVVFAPDPPQPEPEPPPKGLRGLLERLGRSGRGR